MNRKSCNRGLTLVEIMVVILILGLLMGMIAAALGPAMNKGRRTTAMAEILQMKNGIGLYEKDNRDFPPTMLSGIGLKTENEINSGAESIVACLSSEKYGAEYYEFKDDKLENSDNDKSKTPLKKLTVSSFETDFLWELVDPWRNPYIYFHHQDLAPDKQKQYIINGAKMKIAPNTEKNKTGKIPGNNEYQIISLGSDVEDKKDDMISH